METKGSLTSCSFRPCAISGSPSPQKSRKGVGQSCHCPYLTVFPFLNGASRVHSCWYPLERQSQMTTVCLSSCILKDSLKLNLKIRYKISSIVSLVILETQYLRGDTFKISYNCSPQKGGRASAHFSKIPPTGSSFSLALLAEGR